MACYNLPGPLLRLSEKPAVQADALRGKSTREQTRTVHLREVAGYLG